MSKCSAFQSPLHTSLSSLPLTFIYNSLYLPLLIPSPHPIISSPHLLASAHSLSPETTTHPSISSSIVFSFVIEITLHQGLSVSHFAPLSLATRGKMHHHITTLPLFAKHSQWERVIGGSSSEALMNNDIASCKQLQSKSSWLLHHSRPEESGRRTLDRLSGGGWRGADVPSST